MTSPTRTLQAANDGRLDLERIVAALSTRFSVVTGPKTSVRRARLDNAPPLLPVTDAAVLSTIAGGTVVVVGAGMVDRDHLAKSLQSLEAVQGRLLGLVINLMPTKGDDAYSYYRAGYAPESPRRRAKDRERASS